MNENSNIITTEISFSFSSNDPSLSTLEVFSQIYQSPEDLKDYLSSKGYSIQQIEIIQDPTFPTSKSQKVIVAFLIAIATGAGNYTGKETAKVVHEWLENKWGDVSFEQIEQKTNRSEFEQIEQKTNILEEE